MLAPCTLLLNDTHDIMTFMTQHTEHQPKFRPMYHEGANLDFLGPIFDRLLK